MIVVGSGVLGLSCAEYFSRSKATSVTLVSNENSLSGSLAAAANLATKGQQYARDPHFAMKLEGKRAFGGWIRALLTELNALGDANFDCNYDLHFKSGVGVDVFESVASADAQFHRVKQDNLELQNKALPLDGVGRLSPNHLAYTQEAWIDAPWLLSLLRRVCSLRGVRFVTGDAAEYLATGSTIATNNQEPIVVCAGAWTPLLIGRLGLSAPRELKASNRFSVGSTLTSNHGFSRSVGKISGAVVTSPTTLVDFCPEGDLPRITVSGSEAQTCISSSTVKLGSFSGNESWALTDSSLQAANSRLRCSAERFLGASIVHGATERTGIRVGFGHSELVIVRLDENFQDHPMIVCAGAHKSGFLFAPVIGRSVDTALNG